MNEITGKEILALLYELYADQKGVVIECEFDDEKEEAS